MRLPILVPPRDSVAKNGRQPEAPETAPTSRRPDPQVRQRAPRRRFTISDKRRILAEADACPPGQLGTLLRREGLYASTLYNFRKQRDAGKLGKDPDQLRQQRCQKEAARQRDARTIARLEAENHKLKILVELQKKVAELMSLPLENPTQD